MATTTARKAEKIDIRLMAEAKETLRRAAAAQGRTVSDFVLDSALQRAAETLPDRTRFELGAKQRPGPSKGTPGTRSGCGNDGRLRGLGRAPRVPTFPQPLLTTE